MRVLVLGAYGVIGTRVCLALLAQGHEVIGLGRSTQRAQRRLPAVTWIAHDLRDLATAAAWQAILREVRPDALVNAAGALQDSAKDDVRAVQETSILALIVACRDAAVRRFVQISATRAIATASTAFMQTKAVADQAVRESDLEWVILRPGLVLASDAYGGTALVRALAGMPVATLLSYPDARLQTVDVDDVAHAVVLALSGSVPARQTFDLVEDDAHTLRDLVGAFRAWLGLPPARVIAVPDFVAVVSGHVADLLGRLGWRSPLRTTALEEIRAGVAGDPAPWQRATGERLAPLHETLARRPSTVPDRWFARLYLLLPIVIGVLSLFWIASGLIGLWSYPAAMQVLAGSGLPKPVQSAFVAGGAVTDIGLGLLILWRGHARLAALGMVAGSLLYLVGGTLLTPHLWSDPLGPLVKVLPGIVLAVVAAQMVDER